MTARFLFLFVLLLSLTLSFALFSEAGVRPIGDITLVGHVERGDVTLRNDSTLFEGDAVRTGRGGGGVIRLAEGRLEIGESSELEFIHQDPLKVLVKRGTIAFNFPRTTPIEIITPQ